MHSFQKAFPDKDCFTKLIRIPQEKILNLHSENFTILPVENGILHEGAYGDKCEPQFQQYLTFPLGVSTRLNLQIYTITNSENSQIYTIRKSKRLNLLIIM